MPGPTGRPGARRDALLWAMRLGIMAMLSVALAALYSRYHLSDEQQDLLRYAEVDVKALSRVQGPLEERMKELFSARKLSAAQMRGALVDEVVPGLLRLRHLAEAPLRAPRSPVVAALATEYLGVVDGLIDACRTAVRVIDDPGAEPRAAVQRINEAFAGAAARQRAWQEHVAAAGAALRLR